MKEKINQLAKLIEHDQIDRIFKQNLACDHNILGCQVHVTPKKKYTCVDVGTCGMVMIDNVTGEVYGIKGYGSVNKNRAYGTLDTIYNYYWGEYSPMKSKTDRESTITELQSAEGILNERNVYIDADGRLYGEGYGEKKESEAPKVVKEFGSDRYGELERDLSKARILAYDVAERVPDSGTCNLDGVFLSLKGFKEDETVKAIHNSGLGGYKTKTKLYGNGYLISLSVGQALKRERAAETIYKQLKAVGYDVAHWQQMD